MTTSCVATASAAAVQLTEDPDDHEREAQAALPIESVAVPSRCAKTSPVTIMDAAPLVGELSTTWDDTGTSKEKRRKPVPTYAPMEKYVAETSIGLEPPETQMREVTLDQVEVRHMNSSKRLVPLRSMLPKLRPDTEIQDPPDDGTLAETVDMTELSKVRSYAPVPAKAATVTVRLIKLFTSCAFAMHKMDVEDDQDDVAQLLHSTPIDCVKYCSPKFKPAIETAVACEWTKFHGIGYEAVGESNVHDRVDDPTSAPIDTARIGSNEAIAGLVHAMLVAVVQDTV